MKIIMSTIIVALGLTTTACNKTEDPSFKFDKSISWAGTGCKSGKGTVTGKNTDTLVIDFKDYDAGKDAVSGLKRAACSFTAPIKLADGYQVANVKTEWEGYVKGKGEFSLVYFIAGQSRMPRSHYTYIEPNGNSFVLKNDIPVKIFGKACGGSYNFRINSDLRVKDSNSHIINKKLTIKLKIKPCVVSIDS